MRVKEYFHDPRGLALGEVLFGKLVHGADERGDGGNRLPGVAVGLQTLIDRRIRRQSLTGK